MKTETKSKRRSPKHGGHTTRSNSGLPRVKHVGTLPVDGARITCYVLETGTRLLSQRGINEALGITHGGPLKGWNGMRLPRYLSPLTVLAPALGEDSMKKICTTCSALTYSGQVITGVPAQLLPSICQAWLAARELGLLNSARHFESANRAEAFTHLLACAGAVGLVDQSAGNGPVLLNIVQGETYAL